MLLTTRHGKCIRFAVTDVRVFKGRESTGVRGIKSGGRRRRGRAWRLLHHSDASSAEARAYLQAGQRGRAAQPAKRPRPRAEDVAEDEEVAEEATLTPDRYAALGAREQFVLRGFGQRLRQAHLSSYEYRVTGRGGSGIVAMGMGRKNSAIISAFPVEESDDLMLISDKGQTIRVPVKDICYQGRAAQGVTVFRLDEDERVVSVERIAESSAEDAPKMTRGSGASRGRHGEKRIGLYPGTFDPVTLGHLDIIKRAVKLVDHLVIGVATNAAKSPLFTLEERVEIVAPRSRAAGRRRAGDHRGRRLRYAAGQLCRARSAPA